MKSPTRPRRFGLEVNLTPLIDVVFNLVIFFLVASHFARSEVVEEVELPAASQISEQPDIARRLLITIMPDGSYHTSGERVDLETIEVMLREAVGDDPTGYAVHIRGDRAAPFGVVEKLLVLCPKLGITDVGFKVRGTAP